MLEKTLIAYILQLALNYTGNPPLPADFPIPQLEFVSVETLVLKSCEYATQEQMPKCLKYYGERNMVGLYDRFRPKFYIVDKLEQRLKNKEPYAVGVALHEFVHFLQIHYKHHDNSVISAAELKEDEEEAYAIERKFVKSHSE